MINAKAKELGMNNTSFANPIGMDDKNNYSTVNDLSILFKAGLKNGEFKKIISTFEYKLSDGTPIKHTIYYYMKIANISMPQIKGGKTGYTEEAGLCLASYATDGKNEYALVTTHANGSPYTPQYHVLDALEGYDYFLNQRIN